MYVCVCYCMVSAAGTTKPFLEPINQDWLMVAPLPGHDVGSMTDVRVDITAEDVIRVHYAYSLGIQVQIGQSNVFTFSFPLLNLRSPLSHACS